MFQDKDILSTDEGGEINAVDTTWICGDIGGTVCHGGKLYYGEVRKEEVICPSF